MSNDKKLILVVDDDIDLLEQMKTQLEAMGHKVATAESQEEGEKFIASTTPDLAVIDLLMENQDSGFVLCYKLKKKSPATPIIIVSGVTARTGLRFDAETDEERAWLNADVVLNKSVRFEQLEREVNRLLKLEPQAHA